MSYTVAVFIMLVISIACMILICIVAGFLFSFALLRSALRAFRGKPRQASFPF